MMDKVGAPEIVIVFLLGVVPLIVWAAGNIGSPADIPDEFRDELKKRMDNRLRDIGKTNENTKPLE